MKAKCKRCPLSAVCLPLGVRELFPRMFDFYLLKTDGDGAAAQALLTKNITKKMPEKCASW